jgi:hypothetical protein
MPRFNPFTGEAVMGVGNGPLSVDGRLLRSSGGGPSAWFDVDIVLHQIDDRLSGLNIRNGDDKQIGPGVNEVSAGCVGTYLAWTPNPGLYGEITLPQGGLNRVITDARGANPSDGCLVYISSRNDDNASTIVRHPSGEEAHLPGAYGLHVLRWGQAVWNAGNGTLGFWGLACVHLPGAAYAKLVDLDGILWIVYWLDGVGLIAHRGQSPDVYYVITESEHCYHHDAIAFQGRMAVCYSTTVGEGSDHLVKVMDVQSMPSRPYEKPGKPPPIPLDQIIPLQGKWVMAWYEQKGPPEMHNQPLPPGNMEIAVYTANYPPGTIRPRPVIVMMDGIDRIEPMYLVRLGSEGDHSHAGLEKIANLAWDLFEQGIQTAVYWDDRNPPYWPDLPPDCIWEQVAYCGVNESLGDFESFIRSRGREVLARYKYLMFACQTHTTNSSLLQEPSKAIPPVQRVVTQLRAEFGERMAGLSVFNNSGRDDPNTGEGGLTAPNNQDLRPHWGRLYSGVTGLPDIFGKDEEDSMRVVIHSYDPECNRSDPHGHGIDFEIEEPPTPCHVTVGLDDGEEPMGFTIWTTRKNGHYFRGIRHKPGVNGNHPVVIRVLDAPDLNAGVLTETRSNGTVKVYSPT